MLSALMQFLWFVRLPRGARFLAKCGGGPFTGFPTFSDNRECPFAREDAVDEEKDERRFWVDIFSPQQEEPGRGGRTRTSSRSKCLPFSGKLKSERKKVSVFVFAKEGF